MKKEIEEKLIKHFNLLYEDIDENNVLFSFCPYRVCPVGAHIDHQKGIVTGFAIDYGVTIAYVPSNSRLFEVSSLNFEGTKGDNVVDVSDKQNDWADYLRGTAKVLYEHYGIDKGIYAVINGSLPIGGVSSSAAVIIAFMKALCVVNGLKLAKEEVIKLAQEVENKYIGVNCGVLDQSCELLSKKDHLLYLDINTNKYELIAKNDNMPNFRIAIIFSGVKRTLVGSAYNTRVDELKSASYALKAFSNSEYGKYADSVLRDVPRDIFDKYEDKLPLNWKKRARHYYDEMDRVERFKNAWINGDIEEVGQISYQSGESSIYNYEAGSPELIAIHEILEKTEGVYGGRFSGAGFKGCCLAIINPEYEDSIREKITKEYLKKFPEYKDSFQIYYCDTADGCDF